MKFGESFENLKSSISSKTEIDYLNDVSKEIAQDIRQATKNKKFTTFEDLAPHPYIATFLFSINF